MQSQLAIDANPMRDMGTIESHHAIGGKVVDGAWATLSDTLVLIADASLRCHHQPRHNCHHKYRQYVFHKILHNVEYEYQCGRIGLGVQYSKITVVSDLCLLTTLLCKYNDIRSIMNLYVAICITIGWNITYTYYINLHRNTLTGAVNMLTCVQLIAVDRRSSSMI